MEGSKKGMILAFVLTLIAVCIGILIMQVVNGATGLSDQIVAMFKPAQ